MFIKKSGAMLLLVLALFLAGCSGGGTTTTNEAGKDEKKLTEITFSEPARILSLAPFYVAVEKGFLKEERIKAEIASGGGGSQVIASVLSGQAQFAISGPRSMFVPLEKGEDLVAIQSLNSALTFEIALSNEYIEEKKIKVDAPLKDRVASLEGASIGTNVVGDSGDIYTRYLMQLHGIDPSSVKMVKLAGTGPKIGGMKEGVVSGGISSPPFAAQVKDESVGELVIKASEEPTYANMVWEVVFADREYLEENPDIAAKVVRAIGKGLEFTRENPKEAAESIASYFEGTDLKVLENSLIDLKDTFQGYGEMTKESWDNAQVPLVEFGDLTGIKKEQNTEPGGIWTNEYIEEAFPK
ncbi:ABC transporter substrate-binding protein [Cytobacillus oceanisediminis]|uniref:ABC transporter substrate-binding protein n=1 Tax=Cytobacillus oceanisediminis TaxID=665099 RepID=UPI0024942F82|nr:ABC transporter substrate-binding protein [Cytobacillus oceanisediminis]